ncbi:hypothetical protein P4O66_006935, partial [Electrophorus voltai]
MFNSLNQRVKPERRLSEGMRPSHEAESPARTLSTQMDEALPDGAPIARNHVGKAAVPGEQRTKGALGVGPPSGKGSYMEAMLGLKFITLNRAMLRVKFITLNRAMLRLKFNTLNKVMLGLKFITLINVMLGLKFINLNRVMLRGLCLGPEGSEFGFVRGTQDSASSGGLGIRLRPEDSGFGFVRGTRDSASSGGLGIRLRPGEFLVPMVSRHQLVAAAETRHSLVFVDAVFVEASGGNHLVTAPQAA